MTEPQDRRPDQGGPPQQPSYPQQGYPPVQAGYPQQGYPPAQQGYPQQGGPGYPPQGPANQPVYRGGGGPPRKSPLLLIGIVVAAVVALVAIGGIVIGLGTGTRDVPATTITPGPQPPPADEPSGDPSSGPSSDASSGSSPSGSSTPGGGTSGTGVDLGHDVTLVPAAGWEVRKQADDLAQLSDGDDVYVGQTVELDASSNPGQVCTAWHKQLAEGEGGGKFATPKPVDVGNDKLKAATCSAQVTASGGQGSSDLLLVTVVSVRETDGVTVLGTVAFASSADQDQLQKDFTSMTDGMLQTQAAG